MCFVRFREILHYIQLFLIERFLITEKFATPNRFEETLNCVQCSPVHVLSIRKWQSFIYSSKVFELWNLDYDSNIPTLYSLFPNWPLLPLIQGYLSAKLNLSDTRPSNRSMQLRIYPDRQIVINPYIKYVERICVTDVWSRNLLKLIACCWNRRIYYLKW